MDNTLSPLGATQRELGDNFGTTMRQLSDIFENGSKDIQIIQNIFKFDLNLFCLTCAGVLGNRSQF